MATAIDNPIRFLQDLCDALGIDRHNRLITGVTVTADVLSVPVVEVRELAAGTHLPEMRRYTLAELVTPVATPDVTPEKVTGLYEWRIAKSDVPPVADRLPVPGYVTDGVPKWVDVPRGE